jgi:hypothetical protein
MGRTAIWCGRNNNKIFKKFKNGKELFSKTTG